MSSSTVVRNIGIGLTVAGFVLLVAYALYNLFIVESSPVLKVSIGAIVAGIVLVLLVLIREKINVEDKEIERRY